MDFKLTDNSEEVKSAMEKAIARGLEEIGLTAEAYAKLKCPVDTGRLRNSISHDVRDKEVYIGTNVEYAPYVEMGTSYVETGTSRTKAQPFLKPAATEHSDEYKKIIETELRNA